MNPQLTLLKTEKEPLTFRRKPVPDELRRRAESVLEDFNRMTVRRYRPYKGNGSPSEALTRILGRVLEHPDLDATAWRKVIEIALSDPWWSGHPSVGVVFGPRVVENYIARYEQPSAPPIESVEARQKRETRERRSRQLRAIQRLKEGLDGAGPVGGHLPAS